MTSTGWLKFVGSALGFGAVVFLLTWCPGPIQPISKWLAGLVGYTGAVCATAGGSLKAAVLAALTAAWNHWRNSPKGT